MATGFQKKRFCEPESEYCVIFGFHGRVKEKMVHVLECVKTRGCHKQRSSVPDRCKMVKMFSRSAAGKDMLESAVLRPPAVLKKTINYLLGIVVAETELPWTVIHEFVTDRLRAIRQDMVVQRLAPDVCCTLLEPIVRFHAYSAYRLCEEPMESFDPVLNRNHLNECLKQLLVCYDTLEDNHLKPTSTRDQMEALYGLLHLGNEDALYRMLILKPAQNSLLNDALLMSIAHYRNDYMNVCRKLRHLPPLLACVAALNLSRVRRQALSVMNIAYSSKNLRYPLHCLTSLLLFPDEREAAEECRNYGLTVEDDVQPVKVHFFRGAFNAAAKEGGLKRLQFIEYELAKLSLPSLLLETDHS